MRASMLVEPGRIEMVDSPKPRPIADEVLVQVAAVGICGSDVHYFRHGRIGDFVLAGPLVLGHEAAGTIVEVGPDADARRIGERVSIEPQRACGACERCADGEYNLCSRIRFFATPPVDGAFCEFVAVRSKQAFAVPASMSFDAAALCEPLSVAIWAHRKAATRSGDRVLIAGAGPIGLLLAQVARAAGAAEIVVTDISRVRREVAKRFGADRTIDPDSTSLEKEAAFDRFLDASGAESAIRSGIDAVRPGGSVVLVGMGVEEVGLPVASIRNRELQLTGTFRYADTWPSAVELIASGAIDVDTMVTARVGLDDVQRGLELAIEETSIKVIVDPRLHRRAPR